MNEIHLIYDGERYSFPPGQPVRIGRGLDNEVVVSDPTVSRQHAQLSYGPDGWVYENIGRAPTFVAGQTATRVPVTGPVELSLASPQGPTLRLEPSAAAPPATGAADPLRTQMAGAAQAPAGAPDPQITRGADSYLPHHAVGPTQAQPGAAGGGPVFGQPGTVASGPVYGQPGTQAQPGAGGGGPVYGQPGAAGGGPVYGQPGMPGGPVFGQPGAPGQPGTPGAWPGMKPPGQPPRDELSTAFHILVPIKSWLREPGWRQGLRLLVIAYALLPLIFLAIFSSSMSLTTPGFLYSLYIAPLWAIVFWLLIRPGPITRQVIGIGVGIIIWVVVWLYAITIPIDSHLATPGRPIPFFAAIGVGYNEEITKALPVFVAAILLLKLKGMKLDVRMWMLLGTVAGLTFGVLEEKAYTASAILNINSASSNSQADAAVLEFAFRVFVDGFQHAIWAGVSAFFIGMAVNYPRRRWQLIAFGVSIAAILHALNDWGVTNIGVWFWIGVQAVSLLLFLGYTMSATSIERQVRQTPLFRGDSMLMDRFSRPEGGGPP
jgi:RsiW-degrading membrane proteinase PrsW (M82 family)